MPNIPLSTDELRRFTSCLNLMSSDKDGEVVAAARGANRILAKHGMTWMSFWYDIEGALRRSLMESQPTIDDAFREILAVVVKPSGYRDFLVNLRDAWINKRMLTEKQRESLRQAVMRHNIRLWPRVITW